VTACELRIANHGWTLAPPAAGKPCRTFFRAPGAGALKETPLAPIGTDRGTTPFSCKQAAGRLEIATTAATRSVRAFEDRALVFLRAYRGLDPHIRDHDLAEMFLATVRVGGALSGISPEAMLRWLTRLAAQARRTMKNNSGFSF